MAQSDDNADQRRDVTKADLLRENKKLKTENEHLKAEVESLKTKFSNAVQGRRVTKAPGGGTPVSCIDDIGGEGYATTKTKKR